MSAEAAALCSSLADGIFEIGKRMRGGSDWPLIAPPIDPAIRDTLVRVRERFCDALGKCSAAHAETVIRSSLFASSDVPINLGLVFERGSAAQQRIDAARGIMAKGWTHAMARHAFLIAALHAQPMEMPLMSGLTSCPDFLLDRYLTWLFCRPCFRREGDDARYVQWLVELLGWLQRTLCATDMQQRRGTVLSLMLQKLDIGMMIYSDVSIRPVLDARARLIETVASMADVLRGTRAGEPPPRAARQRIRLGFLIRTLMRHPDPLAFCSQFEMFDPERYEIILYSHDLVDRQCTHDIALYKRLFNFVSAVHSLNGLSVRDMIDKVHADDLDIFVFSYAATIGVTPTDCLVNARLARIQVLMNSFVPIATGLPSFSHVATVRPPAASRATIEGECREALAEIPQVLLSYPPARAETPERIITRAILGIPDDAPVLYNGGAVDKIVPLLTRSWIRALARIPNGYLVLAPFNPGWTGAVGAPNLFGLLDNVCAAEGVARDRVIVLRELSPRDTTQILQFSTAYLGTFPHGSSTSIALALQAGVPVATRRSPWLRGTGDASIVNSIGVGEMIADNADEYVDLVVRLAIDAAWNRTLRERIVSALPTAPFLSSPEYGRSLQHMFDDLAHTSFGHPVEFPVAQVA